MDYPIVIQINTSDLSRTNHKESGAIFGGSITLTKPDKTVVKIFAYGSLADNVPWYDRLLEELSFFGLEDTAKNDQDQRLLLFAEEIKKNSDYHIQIISPIKWRIIKRAKVYTT